MSAAASGASIRSLIAAAEGSGARVGLYARRPDGEFFGYRDDEVFPSASTIKIGIMIELFRRIDAGEFDLDQRHQLRATDQAAGSGVLQHLDRGLNPTLRDLCYLMMSISDNLATNIIIGLLGLDRVNATLGSLGLTVSVLGRPMQGRPAMEGEQENLTTPAEIGRLVQSILDGSAASIESCAGMRSMLEKQQNNRRIGRYLPTDMVWGSKTGSYATLVHDVGYVQSRSGPVVIAALAEKVPDMVAGEVLVSELVRELLRELHREG